MGKQNRNEEEIKIERPEKLDLSAKESIKRTEKFDERKDQFIAAIREGKDRSLYS